MARSSATWKPGIKSPNPGGKPLPERLAQRTLAETLRNMLPGEELGRALLTIAAGVDPWAEQRGKKPNPDNLPVPGDVPLDWTHRMAALKMYVEYAHGKPLQGVIVDAQVRQETRVVDERSASIELRELVATDPTARAAMRQLVGAMMGRPALPVLDVQARNATPIGAGAEALSDTTSELTTETVADAHRLADRHVEGGGDRGVSVPTPEELDEDELEGSEDGPVGEDVLGLGELGDLHASMVRQLGETVNEEKKPTRFPGEVL